MEHEHTLKELKYLVGLTMIQGIGPITARRLVSFCGSAAAVFHEKKDMLLRIPGVGPVIAETVFRNDILGQAEQEIAFAERYKINIISFHDEAYPGRLRQCVDAPLLLYAKGSADLSAGHFISVVGTRKATAYGREACRSIIEGLAAYDVTVVSGLAYGIDTCSHHAALNCGLNTIGVLGHGLDRIYPACNKNLAERMLNQGALVTDFPSGTRPDRENFPRRNRIIAGLADATVVVEAAEHGGALITADIANSYNRDVFAVPGRWTDHYSHGCNYLIRTNRAALIQSADDILYLMGWQKEKRIDKNTQIQLFISLSPDEEVVVRVLQENGETGIDLLTLATGLGNSTLAKALLNLEIQGIILAIPGKRYSMAK